MKNGVIRPEHLATHGQLVDLPPHGTVFLPEFTDGFALDAYLSELRVRIIEKALHEAAGNQSLAARLLHISPQAVHQFLKKQRGEVEARNGKTETKRKKGK